jgi:FKBP-type peptidyl-prolyl cis-trans isomerase FkpA
MNRVSWLIPFIIFLFSACIKNNTKNCNYNACEIIAPTAEVTAVENYLSSKNITNATKHCSGMYYKIDTAGNGSVTPGICSIINITYKGYLTDGRIFDQSTTDFVLDQLITGWKIGIPLIKAGGKIQLYIPPSLGYGYQDLFDKNQNLIVPRNSVLIFEITLNTVR